MKIECVVIGKTDLEYLKEGIAIYEKRLKHYIPFEWIVISDIKNAASLTSNQLKEKEGSSILNRLDKDDFLIILDEHGKQFTSVGFSTFIDHKLQIGIKKLVFQVGGAYGFSEEVQERANFKMALSNMTFSHQMIRLLFIEQVYRAFTILKGEKYHNP
jgi:23S rRNA (pseudouridine1915-N3)-methyltransferase